jgi:prepilin-type N-terminal cleavage/methylation domain-containing protein
MKRQGVGNQGSGFRVQGSGTDIHPFTSSPLHPFTLRPHSGFTLLEVILALGLTAIVISLVGTAVNSTLRTIDSGRRRTEREQLARAIMHRIADDLRAVVRYEPFDDSGLNSDIGGVGGSTGGNDSSNTSSDSNQTGGNTSGQNNNGTGTQTSNSQSSQDEESTEPTLTVPIAGIYGFQNEVRIDITRIPRLDEYLYADGVNTPLPRGDVRTVTYFLGGSANGLATTTLSASATTASTTASGLARMEIDRATALWQTQSASAAGSQNVVVLAPEVASLEFRYFDGSQWLTEWDTTTQGGVPRAVEISIYLYDDRAASNQSSSPVYTAAGAMPAMDNPDNLYRLVVHLPAGLPLPAIPPATTEETSQENSNSNTSTNNSSSSGTSQNGGQQ